MLNVSELTIDLTAALANAGTEYKVNVTWEFDGTLPYADSVVKQCRFAGYCCFTKPDVELCGTIFVEFDALCDSCGEQINRKETIDFNEMFYKTAAAADDYTFLGSKLHPQDAFTEQILLNLPVRLLCDETCKGVCTKCGKNLNYGDCGCKQ